MAQSSAEKYFYLWVGSKVPVKFRANGTQEAAESGYKNPKAFRGFPSAVRFFYQILILKYFALNTVIQQYLRSHEELGFPCHTSVPVAPNAPLSFFNFIKGYSSTARTQPGPGRGEGVGPIFNWEPRTAGRGQSSLPPWSWSGTSSCVPLLNTSPNLQAISFRASRSKCSW